MCMVHPLNMWMGMLHIIVAVIIDRLRSCKISGNTMELEMTREDVFEQLTAVFRDVFDSDDIVLKEDTVSSDIQDWDSLEFINIVVAVMETFKIKFSIEDLKKLKNIGEMVTLILARQKKDNDIFFYNYLCCVTSIKLKKTHSFTRSFSYRYYD